MVYFAIYLDRTNKFKLYRMPALLWGERWDFSEYEERAWMRTIGLLMYEIGPKPKRSEAFARVICHIAVKERGLSIESLSESELEGIAGDALLRYPIFCDVRFRKIAIGRVRLFQRSCEGQKDYLLT